MTRDQDTQPQSLIFPVMKLDEKLIDPSLLDFPFLHFTQIYCSYRISLLGPIGIATCDKLRYCTPKK